jgi:para-nitrobenzyl esterase
MERSIYMNTTVEIKYGTVEGFKENGLAKWFRVPFAEPPVGELRFRRAVECEKWNGIRSCKQHGNKPIQFASLSQTKAISESEDCLYLSIWRSDNEKKKLPVFVWIYGGAFIAGECSEPGYDGSTFAKEDILYVAINYRLGVLGFYDFTGYDKENFDSNCGLSDQIMALKWIKENIEAFGGDSENITIAGESAGGTSVCNLLAAPTAKGLFHKAISQSGLPDYGVYVVMEQKRQ